MDAVCGHLPILMVSRRGSAFAATLAECLVYAAARAKSRHVWQWLARCCRRRAMRSAATLARLSAGLAHRRNCSSLSCIGKLLASRSVWNQRQPSGASLPSRTCGALFANVRWRPAAGAGVVSAAERASFDLKAAPLAGGRDGARFVGIRRRLTPSTCKISGSNQRKASCPSHNFAEY